MKKFLIAIIIILTIAMVSQSVYYNITAEKDNSTASLISSEIENTTLKEDEFTIVGLSSSYEKYYKGEVKLENITSAVQDFLNINIPKISELTTGKDESEIEKLFNKNQKKFNEMNIFSFSSLYRISQNLNNISYTKDFVLSNISATIGEYTENEGYGKFELTAVYENGSYLYINLFVNISSNEPKIKLDSDNEYIRLYKQYEGDIGEAELENAVNNFINEIPNINKVISSKSQNYIKQYYDINKEKMQNLYIQTADDFYNITLKIIKITWSKSPKLISNSIRSFKKENEYSSFVINLRYSTNEYITFKVFIANSSNTVPNFKIESYTEVGD